MDNKKRLAALVEQVRKVKIEQQRERDMYRSGKIPQEDIKKLEKTISEGFKGLKEDRGLLARVVSTIATATKDNNTSVGRLLSAFREIKFDFPKIGDFRREVTDPLEKELQALRKLVEENKLPKDASDPLSVRLSDGEKFYNAINNIAVAAQKSIAGGGSSIPRMYNLPGSQSEAAITVSGLSLPPFDYVSMALSGGNTTETYTFKQKGATGTTVATVAIVYTTSTRDIISTVTKT